MLCGAQVHVVAAELSRHLPPSTHNNWHIPMSSTPKMINFEGVFNAALAKYANQTGHDLSNHPLASKIDGCDSAESILAIFQEQANAFHEFRHGDPKLMKWLQPVVTGLYTLSASPALRDGVSLVSTPKFFFVSDRLLQ